MAPPAQSRCGPPELRPTFTHGGPRTPAQVPGWFRPTQAFLDRCLAASRHYVNRVADSLVGRVTKIFDAARPVAHPDIRVAFITVPLSHLAGLCQHHDQRDPDPLSAGGQHELRDHHQPCGDRRDRVERQQDGVGRLGPAEAAHERVGYS